MDEINSTDQPEEPTVSVANRDSELPRQVEIIYFHSTRRCQTCLWIENHAEEAVLGGFEQELGDSLLVWHSIDFEEPGNEHFAKEFELYTQTLILIENIDGHQTRTVNLEKIWELVREDSAFINYVREETRGFLDGA